MNVTDNQSAVVRMSSWLSCVILKEMGIDPVMQIVVRDRKRLAIQSDVLGAVALGIRNFLRHFLPPKHFAKVFVFPSPSIL